MRNGGKRAVESGKTWEREVVKLLKSHGGFLEARRTHQDRQGHTKSLTVPDLEGTPYWVECSRAKKLKWTGGLALADRKFTQALRDRERAHDTRPVLVFVSCGKTGSDRFVVYDALADLGVHEHVPVIHLNGTGRRAYELSWPSAGAFLLALGIKADKEGKRCLEGAAAGGVSTADTAAVPSS